MSSPSPRRRGDAWLLFALAVSIAALGLGWLSRTLVRLDDQALASESTRLALWRMDLALARLISVESARPLRDYQPGAGTVVPQGVRLHFDVAPPFKLTTPQLGADEQVEALRPLLMRSPLSRGMRAAAKGSRNADEFNRRNNFALNNMNGPEEEPTPMAPAWYGDTLVLARRVRFEDGMHTQGAWLDWESLRKTLLREVSDLLPEARLEPAGREGDAMRLASLPVRLEPGRPADDPERASVTGVIAVAWVSLALVASALGLLLFGALTLDERRSAFVSAVTHELRTPLTTFKLYAEMLEEGMVPPEKQKEYLGTLRQEANRLGYLVENVLAYAQIERGRERKPLEELAASELLDRIIPRLRQRAPTLKIEPIPSAMVKADRVSVEQILFNLVDNAAKYSGEATTISFSIVESTLTIAVADRGPGVSPEVERKLFEPLRKSAAEAANGAQGIGLGLALSRRLARAMGGDLRHRRTEGATFELSLTLKVS